MTDETTTPTELSPENFDILDWLDTGIKTSQDIEIYRDGTTLFQLVELTEEIEKIKIDRQTQAAQLLRPDNGSIADEIDSILVDAEAKKRELQESLKGTGSIWHIVGMNPGEREALEKSVARSLKGKKATEDEAAIPAGNKHPDYPAEIEAHIMARSIKKVTSPSGQVSERTWTVEEIKSLPSRLPGFEYQRLARAVIDVTYMTYDIEKLVNADF